MAFIDAHRERFGVEPMCRVLSEHGVGIAPSTYYAFGRRRPSRRALRDAAVLGHVRRIHGGRELGRGLYGVRKVWRTLQREIAEGQHRGLGAVPRCQVERLMRADGLRGVTRGRTVRTTRPDTAAERAPDLVQRNFTAARPNQLWVVDITYVPTWSGMAYAAFVSDVYSRRIVGWRVASSMPTELPLDALEMAIWTRTRTGADLSGLIHHSDAGSQFTAIRYTLRLADAGAVASIGSIGDSYDNALAESLIGLYKTELVRQEGPWRTVDEIELATLNWVHWFNTTRLHSSIGDVPPVEHETTYYRDNPIRQHQLPGEPALH